MPTSRSAVLEAILEQAAQGSGCGNPMEEQHIIGTTLEFASPATGGPRRGGDEQTRPDSRALLGHARERQRNMEPAEKVRMLTLYAVLPVGCGWRRTQEVWRPIIVVYTQSSNSPDLNICDLASCETYRIHTQARPDPCTGLWFSNSLSPKEACACTHIMSTAHSTYGHEC